MDILDVLKRRKTIRSDGWAEYVARFAEWKDMENKERQMQEFVCSREYWKCLKMLEEGIMERKLYQNQFGAPVPTEFKAIKNMMSGENTGKRPHVQVAHYGDGKPGFDERQKAVDVYDEALKAGMNEADALAMVHEETGIGGDWLKCVPDWWSSVNNVKKAESDKKRGIRYTKDQKKLVKLYVQYKEEGFSSDDALAKANEEVGTGVTLTTMNLWVPKSRKKAYSYASNKKRKEAVMIYEACKADGMKLDDALNKVNEELKLAICLSTIKNWEREFKGFVDVVEKRPKDEAVKMNRCECGKDVPAEYAYCPYCGRKIESEKDIVLRYCKELFDGMTDQNAALKAMAITNYIKGVG